MLWVRINHSKRCKAVVFSVNHMSFSPTVLGKGMWVCTSYYSVWGKENAEFMNF